MGINRRKKAVRSSTRRRGFKRKPRVRNLPGSGPRGAKNGVNIDLHEALPGEPGFNAPRYQKSESVYVQSGILDGYEGEPDKRQEDWEANEDYEEGAEEPSDPNEESATESEEEAGDWTDEESDSYSVHSDE